MTEDEMQQVLDRALAETGVKGASLGVSVDGRRICVSSGVADDHGAPVSQDHLFSTGSIAKVWTAQIIVALAEAGWLDLRAPVRELLPEFTLVDRHAAAKVSTFHLLTHTSGIDGDYLPTPRPQTSADYFRSLANAPQLHPPGGGFSYCNAGFVVLDELQARLTGRTWRNAVREDILMPAGSNVALLASDAGDRPRATGWRRDDQGAFSKPVSRPAGLDALAAWGDTARATAHDLLCFADSTLERSTGPDSSLFARMWRRQVDGPSFGDGWGLGWRRWKLGDVAWVGHDGGVPGETAFLRLAPDRGLAFALLANAEDGGQLFTQLFAHVCRATRIDVPSEQRLDVKSETRPLREFSGMYRRSGAEIVVQATDKGLSAERIVNDPMGGLPAVFELIPVGDSNFQSRPKFGENGYVRFLSLSGSEISHFSTGLRLYAKVA